MKASGSILGGFVILASLAAACGTAAQTQARGPERALVGATWSGGEERGIAGYENYGGSFVRAPVAIGVHRSLSNPRDWIFVSKIEIGRAGDHALWRGVDTVRASGRTAESYVAYECKRASRGLKARRRSLASSLWWAPNMRSTTATSACCAPKRHGTCPPTAD